MNEDGEDMNEQFDLHSKNMDQLAKVGEIISRILDDMSNNAKNLPKSFGTRLLINMLKNGNDKVDETVYTTLCALSIMANGKKGGIITKKELKTFRDKISQYHIGIIGLSLYIQKKIKDIKFDDDQKLRFFADKERRKSK